MSNTKQYALEKLKSTYDRAINSPNDRSFFISLFEYVDLFETDSLIEQARLAIFEEANKDKAEVERLGKKALVEIRKSYKPIADYVESKGIDDEAINRNLQQYRDIESGVTQMSGTLVENLYGCLEAVLYKLADNKGNSDFVDRFSRLDESVNTKVLLFSHTFYLWNAAYSQYERVKHAKVWFSWDEIAIFHELYKRYEHVLQNDIKNKDYKALVVDSMLMDEIRIILGGGTCDNPKVDKLKRTEYTQYLERVHQFAYYFIDRLDPTDFTKRETMEKMNISYDKETKTIVIEGKKARFTRRGNRYRILDVIMAKKSTKEWQNDELLEKLGLLEPEQSKVTHEQKKVIYDAAKGVNSHIASKTGCTNFLIATTDTTQLNPKYF